MANRSASRHENRKSGGRHRAQNRRTLGVVTWLGAGALTVGLSAAMASGTGVAAADTESSPSSSSPSGSNGPGAESTSTSSSPATKSSGVAHRSVTDAREDSTSVARQDDDNENNPDDGIGQTDGQEDADGDALGPESSSQPEIEPTEIEAERDLTVPVTSAPISRQSSLNSPANDGPAAVTLLALPVAATREILGSESDTAESGLQPSQAEEAALEPEAEPILASSEVRTDLTQDSGSGTLNKASLATVNATNAPKVSVVENYQLTHPASATAVSADGRYVYIGDGNQTVSIVDTRTNRVTTLNIANKYGDIAAAGSYVVVTSFQETGVGALTVIDSRNNKILNRFTVNHAGNTPVAAALNSTGTRTYIVTHNGWVTQVDTRSGAVLGTNQVGGYLGHGSYVAVSKNKLLVARDDSSNGYAVSILNLDNGSLKELVFNASARSIAVTPDGSRAYVAVAHSSVVQGPALIVIDLGTETVVNTIKAPTSGGSSISDLALGADGKRAYYIDNDYYGPVRGGSVVVLDLQTGEKLDEVRFDGWRSELSITKDGKYIYLATSDQRTTPASLYAISTTVGNNYTGPEGTIEIMKTAFNVLSFLDDITNALDRLPTVWNLGALFRLNSLWQGLDNIRIGIEKGDTTKILDGVVDVTVALLPKPAAFLIDLAKTAIGVLLPMGAEDQEEFMNFRAQCMFRKNTDQLSPAEARKFVERYTLPAALVNVPIDHAKYNVGGWFGSPQC